MVCPWVGGGFGPKAAVYPEYLVAAAACRALGEPVKWAETRSEDMVSLVQGRDYVMTAKLGVTKDGKFTGLEGDVTANAGSYPGIGAILPMLTQMMCVGVYDIDKVKFATRAVVTNTTTVGAYRGAGRPEATQLIERVIDVAAGKIGMDPAELRRRNFIQPDAFPLTTNTGAAYDSGEYEKALDAVPWLHRATRSFVPSRRVAGQRTIRSRWGSACRATSKSPRLSVCTSSSVRQRFTTTARRACLPAPACTGRATTRRSPCSPSEVLGIPMDQIKLVNSDTDKVPRGAGTLGSRSLQTAGSAIFLASNEVLSRAQKIAAHLLEAAAEDMVAENGSLHVAGTPAKSISWAELAVASRDASKLPEGLDPETLRHELDFDGTNSTFPFGAHVSVVEVDTETGKVAMLRHIAVDDCGRILNPLLVSGQQHGGIAQGAAQALYEWVRYDEDGNPMTSTLMDYTVPAASELPSFETSNTQTDSPRNPLGAKGIGESGTIGSTPAIHNAVVDALSHLGVVHIDMPCTPERVWAALNAV